MVKGNLYLYIFPIYRSNGNSEYEVELLNEIKYLKIELEGEKSAKLKSEQNYLEIKESCIQLNKRNKELEENNRILLENQKEIQRI